MQPIAQFLKVTSGLSVQFTDSSLYVPTQWVWNFGDGSPTSNSQNPSHTYATPGMYPIVLTVSNANGSNTKVSQLVVSLIPTLNRTIAQMVNDSIPNGINVNSEAFESYVRKWQLYLQPIIPAEYNITNANVFNEAYWPALVNILIAKLIIYDLVLDASKQTTLGFLEISNTQTNPTNLVQVFDYTAVTPDLTPLNPGTITIDYLSANYTVYGPSPACSSIAQIQLWLDSLNLGIFIITGDLTTTLISNGNVNSLEDIGYTHSLLGAYSSVFTATNGRVINIAPPVILDGAQSAASQGPVRYIETGPSKVEWYDKSIFWKNIFAKDGLFQSLISEICSYGSRLQILLPMCELEVDTPLFIILRGSSCRIPTNMGLWDISYHFYNPQQALPGGSLTDPIEVLITNETSHTVNHGLHRYPFVAFIDNLGAEPLYSINHIDTDNFTINFLTPKSGTIIFF